MANILRNLKILEVSSVDRGAGEGVKIVLQKRSDDDLTDLEREAQAARRRAADEKVQRERRLQQGCDEQDEEMAMKAEAIRKAHTDWHSEVEKLVKAGLKRGDAINQVMREQPTLWAVAKRASAAAVAVS